jgi:hypothetical protein
VRTVQNVSLAAEQGVSTPWLVVGDSRFSLSPQEFAALGLRGDRVRVVAPGTLDAFVPKPLRAAPSVRPSDVFFDCGQDGSNLFGSWTFNCQPSSSGVQREIVVGGWLTQGAQSPPPPWVNSAANGVEDVHYDLELDPVFVERMYGPGGLSLRLEGVSYPGNPAGAAPLPFAAGPASPVDGRPTITFNSWILPDTGDDIHGELNSWHTKDTAGLWRLRIVGRGPAPAGWVAPLGQDADAWFPFDPMNPDGGPRPLRPGDYVLMRGPLWQDRYHDCDPNTVCGPWDVGLTRHHAYLEMHPIDWVVRVQEPHPSAHVTREYGTIPPTTQAFTLDVRLEPGFDPGRGRRLVARSVRQEDDERPGFAAQGSVTNRATTLAGDHVDASVTVAPTPAGPGRWKGCWLVSWSEVDDRDRVWIGDGLPSGATTAGDGDTWTWVTDPQPYQGSLAHQSALVAGMHQHYFTVDPPSGFTVGVGDVLVAAVFLDPADPPEEVMLQWATPASGWEHRAFWGADAIAWGMQGAPSRRPMGRLPFSGEWVRLEAPAAAVGLEGATVIGLAFTLFDGRATWDYAGLRSPVPSSGVLRAWLSPNRIGEGEHDVTMFTEDTGTSARVAGRVFVENDEVGATNARFRAVFDAGTYTVTARCPGYPPASRSLAVVRGSSGAPSPRFGEFPSTRRVPWPRWLPPRSR